MRKWLAAMSLFVLLAPLAAAAFDHSHTPWSELLQEHVRWNANGTASTVDYAGFARDRPQLDAYLANLSAVPMAEFANWSVAQRRAFLLNAYNAYTVSLILTAYPNLKSIKDLGSWLRSPWKREFFQLLDEQRSLDDVEHTLLHGAADYDDPRIHFAANCASIGCPALRNEAYTAETLDKQLDDQTRRFLRDRSRNRHEARLDTLYLSKIFDWYAGDFERGFAGANSVREFLKPYALTFPRFSH